MLDNKNAGCIGLEELFVGPSGGRLSKANQDAARAICAECPIKYACLADAAKRTEYDVVRGGVYFDVCGTARAGSVIKPKIEKCEVCAGQIKHSGKTRFRRFCSSYCRRREYDMRKRNRIAVMA